MPTTIPLLILTGIGMEATFFLANVSVGNPPQEQIVLLDTGSSMLWIADVACMNSQRGNSCAPPPARAFVPADSKTADVGGAVKPLVYADSSTITGVLLTDTVHLNGEAFPRIPMLLAKSTNGGSSIGQGTMGLEFGGEDGLGLNSFVDAAFPQRGSLGSIQVFTSRPNPHVLLSEEHNSDGLRFSSGTFTIDNSKWYASLRAIGLSTESSGSLWTHDFSSSDPLGAPALLDTGSAAIRVGSDIFRGIVSSLPDCKVPTRFSPLDCACGDPLPTLSLSFEAYESRWAGFDLGKSFRVCVPPEAFVSIVPGGRCHLHIVDGGPQHKVFGHEAIVLGMPVLQSVDFAYDVNRRVVGLAASANCTDPRDSWISRNGQSIGLLAVVIFAAVWFLLHSPSTRERIWKLLCRCSGRSDREVRLLDENPSSELTAVNAEETRARRLAHFMSAPSSVQEDGSLTVDASSV